MILLDTHVVLWWRGDERRLSATAKRTIAAADRLLISPLSCWEVAMLLRKGRIELDRDIHTWVRDLHAEDRVETAPLTANAAAAAALLGDDDFPGDPADQMLYATARELAVPFVSKDQRIHQHARLRRDVRVVW